MTAKTFLKKEDLDLSDWDERHILNAMKEFAKYHVEQALEAASKCVGDHEGTDFGLKKSYPLTNIK